MPATDETAENADEGDTTAPEWLTLEDGERIEWTASPEMVSVVGAVVWGVVFIPVFGLGLFIIAGSILSVRNTEYVATNEALYVKKGVLSTNIESVGLDKIQNTEYRQSFLGKQFSYGSIDISTAGSSGAEITFQAVGDARGVRELITRLSNSYETDRRDGSTEDDAPVDDDPMADLLTELRATRETLEGIESALRDTPSGGPPAGRADGTAEGDRPGDGTNDEGESAGQDWAGRTLRDDGTDPKERKKDQDPFDWDDVGER